MGFHPLSRRALLGTGALATLALIPGLSGCAKSVVNSAVSGCLITAEDLTDLRDGEQSGNIAIIVGESIRRGLPPRAATIAIVTALQESKLYNLNYGDADSLGLFQQRPSQGWGTPAQIMDPWYSSGRFYQALVKVDGWQSGNINNVAQAVQRSAYSQAYAQHESTGRIWASALTGYDPGAITSVDKNTSAGSTKVLTDFVAHVWGNKIPAKPSGNTVTFTVGSQTTAWSVGLLCMCLASQAGIATLTVGSMSWIASSTVRSQWTGENQGSPTTVIATVRSGASSAS